jgi:hypothetical protein
VVIKNRLHWSGNGDFARSKPRKRTEREPRIGECAKHATPKKTLQIKGFGVVWPCRFVSIRGEQGRNLQAKWHRIDTATPPLCSIDVLLSIGKIFPPLRGRYGTRSWRSSLHGIARRFSTTFTQDNAVNDRAGQTARPINEVGIMWAENPVAAGQGNSAQRSGPQASLHWRAMIVAAAKSIPIETEISRRGIKLVGHSPERYGPSPICGGRDRFLINVAKRLFNCCDCAPGGDVIDLVQFLDGVDQRTAVPMLAGFDGLATYPGHRDQYDPIALVNQRDIDRQNLELAPAIWNGASPIDGKIAEKYLREVPRLGDLPGADVLLFLKRCPFEKSYPPCLISLYRHIVTDAAIAITALTAAGEKIKRLTLAPTKGAAIKIDSGWTDAGREVRAFSTDRSNIADTIQQKVAS